MTATGFLAPVGVPLIAVGVVAALLGVGGTLGSAACIMAAKNAGQSKEINFKTFLSPISSETVCMCGDYHKQF